MRVAILDGDVVVNIVKMSDDSILADNEIEWTMENPAYIDGTYDSNLQKFIPPKPFESWVLDEATCLWEAPVPKPVETDADGKPVPYVWDEDAGDWIAVDV